MSLTALAIAATLGAQALTKLETEPIKATFFAAAAILMTLGIFLFAVLYARQRNKA